MKKFFLTAIVTLSLCGVHHAALADDLPGGTANWSGPYIAGSVGYGIATTDFSHTYQDTSISYDATSTSDFSSDGVTGTAAVGYDFQLQSGIVAGLFADYTFGELEGSGIRAYPDDPPLERFNLKYDDTWAIGARVGLLRAWSTLWYATAGYTETDVKLSDARGKLDDTLSGYFLGLGVEQNLRDNLFLKLEYRYANYGDETIYEESSTACGATCYERYDVDTDIHSIRLGVAYKFGAREEPAPPLK